MLAALTVGVLATTGMVGAMPLSQASAATSQPTIALASYKMPAVTVSAATTTTAVAPESKDAIKAADAAVVAATAVTADIAASGLDVGVPDITVDTTELTEQAERLDATNASAHLFDYSDLADDVNALADSANLQVASLRGSLDAAIEKKLAEEAAEKARLEAEAVAAAAAAAAQAQAEAEAAAAAAAKSSSSSNSGSSNSGSGSTVAAAPSYAAPTGTVGDNSPSGAKATAYSMLSSYGWGDDQYGCLVALWDRESGWNYQAYNRSSGATGIPQALPGSKMASAGADWQTNAATQIAWGFGYIAGRYGNPCGAWNHSESHNWY